MKAAQKYIYFLFEVHNNFYVHVFIKMYENVFVFLHPINSKKQ